MAREVVDRARAAGADVAEVSARHAFDLSVRVRLGEVELIEEAGHRGISLRVIREQRVAQSYSSDLTPTGIDHLIENALSLVELSQPDPFAGPADPEELCSPPHPELDLFDPRVASIGPQEAILAAKTAERAALGADPRLHLSEGATFSRSSGTSVLLLSSGFAATRIGSSVSLSVAPVVEDADGKKRRGAYYSMHRHLAGLEDPEAVGREAARRTLQKLGARKVDTQEGAVVFDPDVGRSLLGSFTGCVLGGAIWRKSSYLLEREGTQVASDQVTVIDDPLIPRAPGSRAYDGEGLRARRNVVVDRGKLETFLMDSYSARKLSRRSTASAVRSGGSIGPSTSNLTLVPGSIGPDALIQATPSGLYVTDLMGFGFNPVTGDFSRGAAGLWIQGGELSFAVSEVTISSNLDTMLLGIDLIADDLSTKTSIRTPTFRVAKMTISGH